MQFRMVVVVCCSLLLILAGAPSSHAAIKSDGWWIRVNTAKTEASTIVFQIGTSAENRRYWRAWKSGDIADFAVPREFTHVRELYLHATSNPNDDNAWFCVFYGTAGVRHFDFDDVEDATMAQSDRDDACNH